jgi:hypothetical protein
VTGEKGKKQEATGKRQQAEVDNQRDRLKKCNTQYESINDWEKSCELNY